MSLVVLLDSGPLGSATNPRGSPDNLATLAWLKALLGKRIGIVVPEIADYELRRELLRANKAEGIARLDALIAQTGYLPLTTEVMRTAAAFWARARQRGRPTSADAALDADMILASQTVSLKVLIRYIGLCYGVACVELLLVDEADRLKLTTLATRPSNSRMVAPFRSCTLWSRHPTRSGGSRGIFPAATAAAAQRPTRRARCGG